VQRFEYGSDPSQYVELYRSEGDARPGVVVVIHGGFWRAQYDLALGRPLAADLASRGWRAVNVEYRRVGSGGGWPGTFDDVSAAIDLLADLDVDTSRVVTLGHSAGGQLAVWSGSRRGARVAVTGVVSQAGVLGLRAAYRDGVGASAVPDLLGGTPADVPDRYDAADPIALVPAPVPVVCVHAPADDTVPIALSEEYVAAATAAGGRARLLRASGDHYSVVDPASADWRLCVDAVAELSG
jgi:acetyl esterase/lipase